VGLVRANSGREPFEAPLAAPGTVALAEDESEPRIRVDDAA
jgi:hypothetical protein